MFYMGSEVPEQIVLESGQATMSEQLFKQMEATIAQQQHQLNHHQSKEAALQNKVANLQQMVAEDQAQATQYCFTITMLHQDREREKQAAQARHANALEQHQAYKTRTESQMSELSELVAWNEFTRKAIEDKSAEQRNENRALKDVNDLMRQKFDAHSNAAYRRTQEDHETNKHYVAKHVALVNEHEALKANAVLQAAEIKKLQDRVAREINQNAKTVQEKLALERSMGKTEQDHAKAIKFLEDESMALRSERDHSNDCIKHMGESSHKAILVMEADMRSVKAAYKAEIDRLKKALEEARAKHFHLETAISSLQTENQLLRQDFANLKQESAAEKIKSKDDSDPNALTGLWAKQPNLTDCGSTGFSPRPPLTKEHLQEQNRLLQSDLHPISNSPWATPKQTISPKAMLQKIASLEAQLRAYIVTNILLNSSLTDLTKDYQALIEDNSTHSETNIAQTRKIAEQSRLLSSALSQNKRHEIDKKALSTSCDLARQKSTLCELSETRRETSRAKNERDLLKTEHEALKLKHDKINSQFADFKAAYTTLQTEHCDLSLEHKENLTSHKQLRKQHHSLEWRFDEIQRELEGLKSAHNTLQLSHKTLQSEHDELTISSMDLADVYTDLADKHYALVAREMELDRKYGSLECRFDELWSEKEELGRLRVEDAEMMEGLKGELRAVREGWDVVEREGEGEGEGEGEVVKEEEGVRNVSQQWGVSQKSDATKDLVPWEDPVEREKSANNG